MADIPMKLKNATIGPDKGVDVKSTQQLDGLAKDSPVLNESNETVQYTTPALPKDDLGGRNNPNG